jgi:hypothetical protein
MMSTAKRGKAPLDLSIPFAFTTRHVFDPTAEFGAGSVHSPSQPTTSPLNRIAGQIGFGADETNVRARTVLPPAARPDFITWCQDRYARTGDERFRLAPESWPKRFLHGYALRDTFDRYVRILRDVPGVTVNLHAVEVTGLEIRDGVVRLRASGQEEVWIEVDHALLATGHTKNRILPGTQAEQLRAVATSGCGFSYVHHPYPLQRTLENIPSGLDTVVGCRGMGVTAFDVVLHLTEGRGGEFVREPDAGLVYRPSGREPRLILFSRSGIFTATRPHNAKQVDIAALEHRAAFFTCETIDRLRDARGRGIHVPGFGLQRQLARPSADLELRGRQRGAPRRVSSGLPRTLSVAPQSACRRSIDRGHGADARTPGGRGDTLATCKTTINTSENQRPKTR